MHSHIQTVVLLACLQTNKQTIALQSILSFVVETTMTVMLK